MNKLTNKQLDAVKALLESYDCATRGELNLQTGEIRGLAPVVSSAEMNIFGQQQHERSLFDDEEGAEAERGPKGHGRELFSARDLYEFVLEKTEEAEAMMVPFGGPAADSMFIVQGTQIGAVLQEALYRMLDLATKTNGGINKKFQDSPLSIGADKVVREKLACCVVTDSFDNAVLKINAALRDFSRLDKEDRAATIAELRSLCVKNFGRMFP